MTRSIWERWIGPELRRIAQPILLFWIPTTATALLYPATSPPANIRFSLECTTRSPSGACRLMVLMLPAISSVSREFKLGELTYQLRRLWSCVAMILGSAPATRAAFAGGPS